MSKANENIGCNNQECIKKDDCKRQTIAKNGTAKEIRSFSGTKEKGCKNFIPND
jgi:hypothetical protein